MERFSFLPSQESEYFFCMICLTENKERYKNFTLQKMNIPELALYDAITPEVTDFDAQRSKINFISGLKKGTTALWLSQINIFEHFLKSNYKYLVVLEDDAVVPKNLKDMLDKNYIHHPEFLDLGGTRLGQYASCNLYNKYCITNILDTIKTYPINRGIDHYISNINCSGTDIPRLNVHGKLSNLPPRITQVNPSISNNSMRIYYDKKYK
jgi:GR25 family glycosyltransferase involved in LPS biosynthesis